jgi:hypothetical protein
MAVSVELSAYGSATVNADDLAGDVGRRRQAQERHHRRHLRRLPDATQWNPLRFVLDGLRVWYLPKTQRQITTANNIGICELIRPGLMVK